VNIDMNLAPVLDVDMNLRSTVVGKRSFGVNSSLVSEFG
jgi:beta-glucosidase-like glycosyl hydrolase